MVRPFLESPLDSSTLHLSFSSKAQLVLLDESVIDQDLRNAIEILPVVAITLDLHPSRDPVMGANPRTTSLLSCIISACQRQLCMGSWGPDESGITIRVVRETLSTIRWVLKTHLTCRLIVNVGIDCFSRMLLRRGTSLASKTTWYSRTSLGYCPSWPVLTNMHTD